MNVMTVDQFKREVKETLDQVEVSDRCYACNGRVTPQNIIESHGETFDDEDCVPTVWRLADIESRGPTHGRRL